MYHGSRMSRALQLAPLLNELPWLYGMVGFLSPAVRRAAATVRPGPHRDKTVTFL
jgi:hypothetical protein